jgi:hypothetical protein
MIMITNQKIYIHNALDFFCFQVACAPFPYDGEEEHLAGGDDPRDLFEIELIGLYILQGFKEHYSANKKDPHKHTIKHLVGAPIRCCCRRESYSR